MSSLGAFWPGMQALAGEEGAGWEGCQDGVRHCWPVVYGRREGLQARPCPTSTSCLRSPCASGPSGRTHGVVGVRLLPGAHIGPEGLEALQPKRAPNALHGLITYGT